MTVVTTAAAICEGEVLKASAAAREAIVAKVAGLANFPKAQFYCCWLNVARGSSADTFPA